MALVATSMRSASSLQTSETARRQALEFQQSFRAACSRFACQDLPCLRLEAGAFSRGATLLICPAMRTAVCLQAEKLRIKKQKAKSFTDSKTKGKVTKNSGRWN